jgi:hypothetical protein
LTPEFFRDEDKLQQWSAFVRDLSAQIPPFETVISELAAFIAPAEHVNDFETQGVRSLASKG